MIINAALGSRKINHDQYLEDVRKFDVKRFWEKMGHNKPATVDSETSDVEGEAED